MRDVELKGPELKENSGHQVSVCGTPTAADQTAPIETASAESTPPETPSPTAYTLSMAAMRVCVEKILTEHGDDLNRSERIRLLQWLRGALIVKKKAGRRPLIRVTRAYQAWKEGKRGIALFREHIPRWEKLGHYRRREEQRKLLAAIHSRRRRDGK
jgi:hypothetical protein